MRLVTWYLDNGLLPIFKPNTKLRQDDLAPMPLAPNLVVSENKDAIITIGNEKLLTKTGVLLPLFDISSEGNGSIYELYDDVEKQREALIKQLVDAGAHTILQWIRTPLTHCPLESPKEGNTVFNGLGLAGWKA